MTKRLFAVALLLACFAALPAFAQYLVTAPLTAAASSCAPGTHATACLFLAIGPQTGTVGATLAGTWVATQQFEGSADGGTTWVSVPATPAAGGSTVTSATADGTWTISSAGYSFIRIRTSAWTSGSATATLNPSQAVSGSSSGGSGSFTAGGDLSGTSSSQTVIGVDGVPLCTGFTPTNGEALMYSTALSPNPCYTAASGGAVSSVSNSDSTLTISPTTGSVVASLNLGHANTWTGLQTFGTEISIGGVTPTGATGTGALVFGTSPTFTTGLSSPAIADSGISQYGVLFAGSGGLLSGIPADFYYNDAGYDSLPTLQLGVRGSQPIDAHLEVYGSNDTSAHFHNVGTTGTGLSADGGIISLSAVPTVAALGSGVIMGTLQFGGSDSTSDTEATGAIISAWTTQAWTSSAFGSQLKFYTVPNSSTTLTQALLLDQNQAATFAGAVTISGQLLATEPTGSVWGSATGGAKGAGTINATGLYVNGVSVGTSSGTVTSSGYSSGNPLAAFSTSTNITPATSSNVIALFGSGSCSGYLKSDGTCSTPGGSGTVTVVSSGSLTSTALVTGGGTTTLQTPSTTSTLDGSGNLAVAAGGSLGSADSGSPKFTFAANKATFNQPLYLGTTSNQLVTGTSTNLTTLTFPASSGAVTLTFPITSEYIVGANSDTTTTHVLHATAVAGVFNSTAIGTGDLPGSGATTVNGATCTLNSTCNVETATAGQVAISGGSGAALTGAADMTYSTHTFATTTNGIFDWSAATGTAAFKLPTATSTSAGGAVDYDSTANYLNYHFYPNGADAMILGIASLPTTGHLLDTLVSNSHNITAHDSGISTANVVTASSPGAGIAHFAGSTQALTSSAVVNGDITSMAESKLTGSATATTITETGTGDAITRAGVETGNLTAPYVIENTNSTNNNTSIGALIGAAGTSTGGIGEVVFDVSGTGDIVRWYSGGSVSSGVYTIGTLEGHLSASGALTLASTVSATGANFSGLTASLPVCTDGSKNLSSTCTNLITGAMMANNTVTATQLAAQYSKGQCTEVWGGTGTSNALTSGDDAISNNSCYNDSGVTRTITAVKCRADVGSNTTTVNPTFGSAGTGTTILSGALTCGSSYAYSSSGTVSNASWTTGTGIDPGMATSSLTGTSIALLVDYTY